MTFATNGYAPTVLELIEEAHRLGFFGAAERAFVDTWQREPANRRPRAIRAAERAVSG